MKKTDFNKLNREVLFNPENKKIIWQPRISCWISDHLSRDKKLPEPYTGMTKAEIYRSLNCSARPYEFNRCFERIDDPKAEKYTESIDDLHNRHVIKTPVGTVDCIMQANTSNTGQYYKKWWIETEEDMKVFIWLEERGEWRFNEETYKKNMEIWGDLGAPTMFIPSVGIQDLYINKMGYIETAYALSDYPETVDSFFKASEENHERLIEVINNSPVDVINYGDNLHDGFLPPEVFKKYIIPQYQRRSELLHKAGKFISSHWDGDVKRILPFARECGLDGIEAITPKPQGDVELYEVKEALGDMFLIDGVAAILFDERYPLEELEKQTLEVIELFAPKLVLGISDEISSTGDIERIRVINDIVEKYNDSVQ